MNPHSFIIQSLLQAACIFLVAGRLASQFWKPLTWASLRQGHDYRVTMAFPADGSERRPGLSPSLSWQCRTRTTSHSVGAHGSHTTIPLTADRAQEARPFSKIGC